MRNNEEADARSRTQTFGLKKMVIGEITFYLSSFIIKSTVKKMTIHLGHQKQLYIIILIMSVKVHKKKTITISFTLTFANVGILRKTI